MSILFVALFSSCKEKEEKLSFWTDVYIDEYKDFYDNKLEFELKNNAKLLNPNVILPVFKFDSSKLTNFNLINLDYPDFKPKSLLNIHQKNLGGIEPIFLFYKHWEQFVEDDFLFILIQIEYPLDEDGRNKMILLIPNTGGKKRTFKGIHIRWTSKQAIIPSIENNEGGQLKHPIYMWGVNKSTDTVETNLSLKSVKALFPDFEGTYIYKHYSKIIIDYSFSTFDTSFFQNIKFIK